jgi:hypothetical protein
MFVLWKSAEVQIIPKKGFNIKIVFKLPVVLLNHELVYYHVLN